MYAVKYCINFSGSSALVRNIANQFKLHKVNVKAFFSTRNLHRVSKTGPTKYVGLTSPKQAGY